MTTGSPTNWQRGMHFAFDPAAPFPYGVVGLTLWQGSSYRGLTPEDAGKRLNRYGRIHTPADEWPGTGDRAAATQQLALYVAVIDDTKAIPTLILTRENPGLEHDRLELSEASYEEAKVWVPPPKRDRTT